MQDLWSGAFNLPLTQSIDFLFFFFFNFGKLLQFFLTWVWKDALLQQGRLLLGRWRLVWEKMVWLGLVSSHPG